MENKEFFEDIEFSLNQLRNDAYKEGYVSANKEKEVDPYGRENINFSVNMQEQKEERQEKFKKQRIERGFDDTELWNFDTTILRFVLPRLKVFKEQTCVYPTDFNSLEEWKECIEKMIKSIEEILTDEYNADYEGFELFKKHFFDLWW